MSQASTAAKVLHFDVLVVGAGLSGIAAAYHLTTQRPGTSFVLLETQESFGGTWLTHKYPGARSDSSLYTFGYRFKPWIGAPIASAIEIRKYMGAVIEDNDLDRHIRYGHTITSAHWSSRDALWTVEATRKDTGETVRFTTGFLWMCQGYYRHDQGYTPDWEGMGDFKGRIVHPQTWPEDLDYKGKRVVIIGSGATAATLAPSIADDCEHVTVLQRSPAYFGVGGNRNELADTLRELKIDETWIHEIVRRKILHDGQAIRAKGGVDREVMKKALLGAIAAIVSQEEVDKNFTPSYLPWRQRVAFVTNGDMFHSIAAGKTSFVTDHIDRFVENGILTKSGEVVEADIIITATGFNLCALGDIQFSVDDRPVPVSETVTYRGMMFTGLPNLVWVFGYFRASWTLRADLMGDFVCRLLTHMEQKGAHKVEVALRDEDKDMPLGPWVDPDDFNPGYLTRGMHMMPKSGAAREWRHTQDYHSEKDEFPAIDLDGPEFIYDDRRPNVAPAKRIAETTPAE